MLDVRLGRVRARDWVRIGRGVHQRRDSDVEHLDLRAWQLVLPPAAVFSHLSAARVHGWWSPPAYVEVSGLRVTGPAETVVACARDLGLLDLVVLIDAALSAGLTPEEIRLAARRRRGAPRLLEALQLSDAASESAWESVLRVLHRVCDVPVAAQHEVCDELGDFVARGDLWIVRDADEALSRTQWSPPTPEHAPGSSWATTPHRGTEPGSAAG